jgi:hypothetical protein
MTSIMLALAMLLQQNVAQVPKVSGPIDGPGIMYPGLRELTKATDLSDFNYVAKEYFVSGTANGKPYTTRIVVRQSKDVKKFSGIVVSEIMHSSGNSWMFFNTHVYVMSQGHIHVEIASQKAPTENSIIKSNPERYKKLSIPDAAQVNEITAQIGALIKSTANDGPFAGLKVRHSFLMGTSQSSAALVQYLRTHAVLRMPDGSAIFDGCFPTSVVGNNPIPEIDVPLIQMNTQTEVNSTAAMGNKYRRPDSDEKGQEYRLYEVAGMPHNDSRENPTYNPNPCDKPVTRFPVGAMMAMGLDHLIQWVDKGKVPPRADRILVEDGAIVLDQSKNARGGVRNTYVDVPVAEYGVPNTATGSRADVTINGQQTASFYCSIAGFEIPSKPIDVYARFQTSRRYEQRVDRQLKELIKAGWFLPLYSKQIETDARQVLITRFPHQVIVNEGPK